MNPTEMTLEIDTDFDEYGIEYTVEGEELTHLVDIWDLRDYAHSVAHREALEQFFNSGDCAIEESTHSFAVPVLK